MTASREAGPLSPVPVTVERQARTGVSPTAYTTRVLLSESSAFAFLTCLACFTAAAEAAAADTFGEMPDTRTGPWCDRSEPVIAPSAARCTTRSPPMTGRPL
ncbi:hypothetical protein GCM10020256_15810 [Streptomyces thermocoprophilus]